ncbi:MAG: DNA repair protein RecN [Clostridiales bacterium]|nr:DNA repair protein RecN [Clostridiales bacterium]
MLQKLIIKNIALIDSAEICFSNGLNVLSGETGAGKSVIIESLNFVLGAKADKSLIRSGQKECSVIAEFDVQNNDAIKDVFNELEIEQDDILLISRKFNIEGKSSIKINGDTVTASMLRKFTSILVDVHGQSEHFNLLKEANQLALLDNYGGQEILDIKQVLSKEYNKLKEINKNLQSFGGDESQRLIRLDILNYQIDEIAKASLEDGEDEKLLIIKEKLNNQERIFNALNLVNQSISDEGGVEDILSGASKMLSTISDYDENYSKLYDRLEGVFADLSDISNTANNLLDSFDVCEYNPYEIDSRLDLIKALKSKYGGSIGEIKEFMNNATLEKEKLENFAEQIECLEKEKMQVSSNIFNLYTELNSKRRHYAQVFESNILGELQSLGMKNAQFKISFASTPTFEECTFNSPNGFDSVEFMFSANLGEPLKNLSMVISGGEMSRFMLSIKAQTARFSDVSTFIFDEIDAGISGNVAKVVAEKLAKISLDTQIIAISHLPQVSAMADNNLLIEKNEGADKTTTTVKSLTNEEKIYEIIRLVGGDKESKTANEHAKDLIDGAMQYKKSLVVN